MKAEICISILINQVLLKGVEETKETLNEKGFLDIDIDPQLDLFAEIEKLKKEKNAVILA